METNDILTQALEIGKPIVQLAGEQTAVHNSYKIVETPSDYKTEKPKRTVIKQSIKNKDDFIEFVKEYKEEGTKLFYGDNYVKAVFNYSQKEEPDFCDSSALLGLETTSYFRAFSSVANGKKISQKEFIKILKELEAAIKSHDAIEIVQLAQSLQSVTKVSSMITNTSRAVMIDAEVRGGNKENITLPPKLVFSLPIYKNDIGTLTDFEVEIFAEFEGNEFGLNLICYRMEEIVDNATREMLKGIMESLDGVKAYQI